MKPTVELSLLTGAIVFLLSVSTSAHQFHTIKGALCVSECALNGKTYYWCRTKSGSWNYCSPRKNTDRYGRNCRADHHCELHGASNYWCNLESGSWDYCGQVFNNFKIVSSVYGYYCLDSCEKRGSSYYWCHTHKGYDYCSPREGIDYYGKRCDDGTGDSSYSAAYCDKHNYDYYWCYVDGGSTWGYCSIQDARNIIGSHGYRCATPCLYNEGAGKFSCLIFNGSMSSCSPNQGLDSHGRACLSECAKTETDYYSCKYNDAGNYDHCGIESVDSIAQCPAVTIIETAQPNQCEVTRSVIDHGNNMETNWTMEVNEHMARYTNRNCQIRRDAIAAIAQLRNIGTQAHTIVTVGSVRIDLQGFITRNSRRYANIQIQINRQRTGASDYTTIAAAIVQTDNRNSVNIPLRYTRDALIRSLIDCQPRQCWLQRQPRPATRRPLLSQGSVEEGPQFPVEEDPKFPIEEYPKIPLEDPKLPLEEDPKHPFEDPKFPLEEDDPKLQDPKLPFEDPKFPLEGDPDLKFPLEGDPKFPLEEYPKIPLEDPKLPLEEDPKLKVPKFPLEDPKFPLEGDPDPKFPLEGDPKFPLKRDVEFPKFPLPRKKKSKFV